MTTRCVKSPPTSGWWVVRAAVACAEGAARPRRPSAVTHVKARSVRRRADEGDNETPDVVAVRRSGTDGGRGVEVTLGRSLCTTHPRGGTAGRHFADQRV